MIYLHYTSTHTHLQSREALHVYDREREREGLNFMIHFKLTCHRGAPNVIIYFLGTGTCVPMRTELEFRWYARACNAKDETAENKGIFIRRKDHKLHYSYAKHNFLIFPAHSHFCLIQGDSTVLPERPLCYQLSTHSSAASTPPAAEWEYLGQWPS